jgi:hypothetical protein
MGITVRHHSRLAAIVALAAAVMTVAWFSRALQTGSVTDWLWCAVVAAVGLVHLLVVRDSRAPLMVADDQGVRVRRGETWSGLRWQDIEHVEVRSPGSWLRDGQIVVHPAAPEVDAEDTPVAEAYVVPLARTTKVDYDGLTGDLVEDLHALASGRVPVLVLTRVEHEPAAKDADRTEPTDSTEAPEDPESLDAAPAPDLDEPVLHPGVQPAADEQDPVVADRPFTIPQQGAVRVVLPRDENDQDDQDHQDETVAAREDDGSGSLEEPTAPQARRTSPGRWARLFGIGRDDASATTDASTDETAGAVVVPEQPSPGRAADEEPEPDFEPVEPARQPQPASRSEVVRDSVRMLPHPPSIPVQRNAETPVVVAPVNDFVVSEPRPASDAVIGPLIAAARHRARLSIDTLSERTRIRPHVLECIEVDDFEACGGDFYARGHLRTLARIFGLDAQQLLDLYDDRYARAEIEARQVFEAELATGIGGGVRATYTGPRWSLLAACVLALAGVWGVARVFNDTPQELVSPAPNVVDSAGLANSEPEQAPKLTLATLEVAADGTSPQVVIRDRDGRILWAGKLGDGQHQQVIGLAPFDVTASNGAAVEVSYLGRSKGTVGPSAAAHSKSFG